MVQNCNSLMLFFSFRIPINVTAACEAENGFHSLVVIRSKVLHKKLIYVQQNVQSVLLTSRVNAVLKWIITYTIRHIFTLVAATWRTSSFSLIRNHANESSIVCCTMGRKWDRLDKRRLRTSLLITAHMIQEYNSSNGKNNHGKSAANRQANMMCINYCLLP